MGSPSNSSVDLEELRDRIWWLIRLRWLAIAGVVIVVFGARRFFGVRLEVVQLYTTAGALAAYNVAFHLIARWAPSSTRGPGVSYFANLQIALDLVALTLLLHFSGGVENPFICYAVFHIVIASILLSQAATYLQATWAVALLAAMAGLEATGRVPHHHLDGVIPAEFCSGGVYMLGEVFAIGTMLYFTAFMATSITSRLRRREAEVIRLSDALREHADDLRQAYDALRQLETARSDYLHRVAHHIRSPLATLERMMAVVSEGRTGEISDRAREMLERARARVHEVLALARDLLVLSRTREALPLADRTMVDLVSLVQKVLGDFRDQAAAASVALISDCPTEPVEVLGDPESLAELIENLVSNAVKYSPDGGEVRVSIERRGRQVELSVTDQGIGIPAGEEEHIFEEFYRAPNARESGQEGTGLGLSIVKAVVQSYGGSIRLEGEAGKGTRFRVTLPQRAVLYQNPSAAPRY